MSINFLHLNVPTEHDFIYCHLPPPVCRQNEVLWREVVSLRQNHTQQQKVMNKVSVCVRVFLYH